MLQLKLELCSKEVLVIELRDHNYKQKLDMFFIIDIKWIVSLCGIR